MCRAYSFVCMSYFGLMSIVKIFHFVLPLWFSLPCHSRLPRHGRKYPDKFHFQPSCLLASVCRLVLCLLFFSRRIHTIKRKNCVQLCSSQNSCVLYAIHTNSWSLACDCLRIFWFLKTSQLEGMLIDKISLSIYKGYWVFCINFQKLAKWVCMK